MSQVRVERGNVVLYVEDYEVKHYTSIGYNVTDDSGKIITKAVATTVPELQKDCMALKSKLEQAEKNNVALTEENTKLRNEIEKLQKEQSTKKAASKKADAN